MSQIQKILLIEDDRFISELYAHTMRKAGYEVDEVVTGPEGLARASGGEYQLVLLDIMIPDKTGIEVLRELRGEDNLGLPNTKIVITTNLDMDDDTRAQLEDKADGYIIKADVTPKTLLELIKQIEEFGKVEDSENI